MSSMLRPRPHYVCYRAIGPIEIDGKLNEESWRLAKETAPFVEIDTGMPAPFHIWAKMLWDDEYFYVAFYAHSTDVWATFVQRDVALWDESDFEVFIDPNGDGQFYCEMGINPINTIYDLVLTKPYMRGGRVGMWDWTCEGLKTAVSVDGTLNVRGDVDTGWSGEFAIPWRALARFTGGVPCPPRDGDTWRVGMSRVKSPEIEGLATRDYTWTVQEKYNMHITSRHGYVHFSTDAVAAGADRPIEGVSVSRAGVAADGRTSFDLAVHTSPHACLTAVTADLSPIGGDPNTPLRQDDGRGLYKVRSAVEGGVAPGRKELTVTLTDASSRKSYDSVPFHALHVEPLPLFSGDAAPGWLVLGNLQYEYGVRFQERESAALSPGADFVLAATGVCDLAGYTALEFYVNGGDSAGQELSVGLHAALPDATVPLEVQVPLEQLGVTPAANTWRRVTVPLEHLGWEDVELTKVRFGVGEVGETLYVTDVALIAESRADVGLPEKAAAPAEILQGSTMCVVAGAGALYAGTQRGLYRSGDRGHRWKRLGKGALHAMAFSLAMEPGNSEVVYAGTWDGPCKSDDGGETWTRLDTGCTQPDVRSIVVHPSDPEVVYLALYGEGVLKSADAGSTWSTCNTGLSNTIVRFLVPDSSDPNRLYAGTGQQWARDNGLFRSEDGGESWSQVSLEAALPTCMVSPAPSVLYVGTWRQGVFASRDDGHSWRPANDGLLARDVWSIAVDPADSCRMYAGTGAGVYRTDDAGQSWSELDAALRDRQVYAISLDLAGALDLLGQTSLYVGTDRGVQAIAR